MQRYFTSKKLKEDTYLLSKDDLYHIKKVMRLEVGEKIEVVYMEQLYIAQIISFQDDGVEVKFIEEIKENNELNLKICLVQSLVKEQKMDYILQKCTELGVSEFYPYQAERSIVKIDKKESQKKIRWQTIVKEASEQSKRIVIPSIGKCLSLQELCNLEGYDYKFLATVNEKTQNLKKVLSNLKECATMVIVVGPEGGFTEKEETKLMENGFIPISLGKSVLRTETAGLFFTSAVRYIDME